MPTILVADDDPLHREFLAILFRSAGYDVTLATDGAELVALATDAPPALILTDLAMPHMDGLAAIRQLRADARTAPLPILAMSARADLADDALAAGATAFFLKPFSLDALLAQVASLVAI